MRDKGYARFAASAKKILDEAEGMALTQDSRDRLERFADDDLRLTLGNSPLVKPLQNRAHEIIAKFDKASGAASADAEALFDKMTSDAATNWPGMVEKVKAEESFDAASALDDADSFKGRTFRLKGVNNRMGWDFKPGDYNFAIEINGTPVAGKYDDKIKQAIADMTETTRHEMTDEDYDVLFVVEGTCKIVQFVDSEGSGTVDGVDVTIKSRSEQRVPAPLIRIIGLHAGPIGVIATE